MDKIQIAAELVRLRGDEPREKIADDVGISVSTLGMYEQGRRIPRDDIKRKLARRYGKSVEQIFFAHL